MGRDDQLREFLGKLVERLPHRLRPLAEPGRYYLTGDGYRGPVEPAVAPLDRLLVEGMLRDEINSRGWEQRMDRYYMGWAATIWPETREECFWYETNTTLEALMGAFLLIPTPEPQP